MSQLLDGKITFLHVSAGVKCFFIQWHPRYWKWPQVGAGNEEALPKSSSFFPFPQPFSTTVVIAWNTTARALLIYFRLLTPVIMQNSLGKKTLQAAFKHQYLSVDKCQVLSRKPIFLEWKKSFHVVWGPRLSTCKPRLDFVLLVTLCTSQMQLDLFGDVWETVPGSRPAPWGYYDHWTSNPAPLRNWNCGSWKPNPLLCLFFLFFFFILFGWMTHSDLFQLTWLVWELFVSHV